jgi:hypothetical protein
MSYGKDERHFDKYVWGLEIPTFSDAEPLHVELAALGSLMERVVAALYVPKTAYFVTARQMVRTALSEHPRALELEALVTDLLGDD